MTGPEKSATARDKLNVRITIEAQRVKMIPDVPAWIAIANLLITDRDQYWRVLSLRGLLAYQLLIFLHNFPHVPKHRT